MNRLKKLRKEQGLSQSELAKKVGISNQVVSFYENNKRKPKIENWQKLADFFGVSVPYLRGATTYEILDPLEKSIYSHVIKTMDRAFNEYALLPETREKILKTIAYSIENGEFN